MCIVCCGAKTISWKACTAMRVMQLSRTDSYTMSADRQTDLGTAVYVWKCTVKYMRKYLYLFVREGSRHGDRQKQLCAELGTCIQARVWKMLHCLTANLPDVAYIHQTRNLQSHTLDCSWLTVHRTENHTSSCRKALPLPAPPWLFATQFRHEMF